MGRQPHTVVIIDPKTIDETDKEPQPGTSKDEELSDISEPSMNTFLKKKLFILYVLLLGEDSTCQKILNYILFVWVFFESALTSLTLFLNKYSKDYRYVLRVLNKEKKLLKVKFRYYYFFFNFTYISCFRKKLIIMLDCD